MKKSIPSLIRTNVLLGFIVLIPIAILGLLFAKLLDFLRDIADALGIESTWGAAIAVVVAVAALLVFSFLLGTAVRTRLGALSFGFFEERFFRRVPGYEVISNILKGFAKTAGGYPMCMVSLYGEGTAVLGLVMEENDNGSVTVFVPTSPAMTIGTIHLVRRDRVRVLDASMVDATNCISGWGIGSRKLLGADPPPGF